MSPTAATSLETVTNPADSRVSFNTAQGGEARATVLRLRPQAAVFEVYDPDMVLRASEVLNDFKIVLRNRQIYSGRAVIRSAISGPTIIVEVALEEKSWANGCFATGTTGSNDLAGGFKDFVHGWQKFYLVADEYKIVVADLQTFLTELRLWLEQLELSFHGASEEQRLQIEKEIAHDLRDSVTSAVSSMIERFEEVVDKIDDDLQPVHRTFGQRQLHSHLLCAPFIHRTYAKPLGYAGDYEMMNMIVRNGLEGTSLYAKLVNAYMLDQAPARAVRNRVGYLTERIIEETARVARQGRIANIYNIACGPAWEVRNFLAAHPLAEQARFRLLDFNEETLQHTTSRLDEVKRTHGLRTSTVMDKNSVHKLLRAEAKPVLGGPRYDLIYSSGLYDYLSNRVCKALNGYLYEQLAPGGLLVIGNFATNNPIQRLMEHALEWFLIYRGSKELADLSPEQAPPENCVVRSEMTNTNIFLEVRKPL